MKKICILLIVFAAALTACKESVTLTFDANGGVFNDGESKVLRLGFPDELFSVPFEPVREGYAFNGWNPEVPVYFPAVGTVYKAQWRPESDYLITYIYDGGTVPEGVTPNPAGYNVESEEIILTPLERKGFTFGGWYSDAQRTKRVTTIPKGSTGNVALYAQWLTGEWTAAEVKPGTDFEAEDGAVYTIYEDHAVLSGVKEGVETISVFAGFIRSNAKEIPVTEVSDYAFGTSNGLAGDSQDSGSANQTLKRVDFSEAVNLTTVGAYAFGFCPALESADFSGCASLETIGTGAFYETTALRIVNLSGCTGLKTVDHDAFASSLLPSVDFSDCAALETVGDNAFSNCSNLTAVDFGGCANLTSVGSGAFAATELTSINFDGCTSLKTIRKSAFEAVGLENSKTFIIDLSDCTALTAIEEAAFKVSCLKTIHLPNSLTEIGSDAFAMTNDLTSIYVCYERNLPDGKDLTRINGLLGDKSGCSVDASECTEHKASNPII